MARVILINPKIEKDLRALPSNVAGREPLAILTLGSYLKKFEVDVRLIDTIIYKEEDLRKKLLNIITGKKKPLLIGFSVITNQIPHSLQLCELIKWCPAEFG